MKFRHIAHNNYRILHTIFKTVPSLFFVTSIKSILLAVIDPLFTIWYFKYIIDAVITQTPIVEILMITIILCGMVVGKQAIVSWYNKVFYPAKALVLRKKMRETMYNKLSKIDISNYDDNESYEKITRAMNELNSRPLAVFDTFFNIIESSVILIASLTIILQIDVFILVFSLISLIISLLFNLKYNKISYRSNMSQIADNRKIDYVHRVLYLKDYSQDIRCTGLPHLLFGMMNNGFAGIAQTYKRENKKLMCADMLPQIISLIATISSIFYIIYKISLNQITVGSFAALLNGSQSVVATIGGLLQFIPGFQKHSMYLDNLYYVFDVKNKIQSGPKRVNNEISSIEFKNVYFKYPNSDHYVLKNLSMRICKGEMVGIVGHNGAGKSTLIKLLLRMYDPTEGKILLNGIDYREYDLDDLRHSIGTVFQNYYVYPFTINENITMDNSETEKKVEIENILQDVGLLEKMQKLDPTMQKQLSNEFEKGIVLSGGEQQKIAIARVLYKSNPVVVMDEPSSALDPVAEAEIINIIFNYFKGRTVFMVSHRLSTTKKCDKIIHISDGSIIECGSHEQLMANGGAYSKLFNIQAENYVDDTTENERN